MYKSIFKEHWVLIFVNLICTWLSFISFYHKTDLFFYDFLSNISYGIIVSTIFYIFVVIIPSINKNRNSAKIFKANYLNFKTQVLQILLRSFYLNGFKNLPDVEDMLDVRNFKATFKDNYKYPNWHNLANSISKKDLILIAQSFKIIHTQLRHFLDNSSIDKDNIEYFSVAESIFMHYSSVEIIELDDGLKAFLRTLWSIFAAFDYGEGYSDEDFIEKRLKKFL